MSKPFKTMDEQIELLKSRGLYFIDEGKSKKILLCNNYYNVINYYSKFFMIDTDNIFLVQLLRKYQTYIISIVK